jgi:hypothetical protein
LGVGEQRGRGAEEQGSRGVGEQRGRRARENVCIIIISVRKANYSAESQSPQFPRVNSKH